MNNHKHVIYVVKDLLRKHYLQGNSYYLFQTDGDEPYKCDVFWKLMC